MPQLSIVIAAYNEEKRLPGTLLKIFEYMRARKESFEVVIVNDGSKDGTLAMVQEFGQKNKELRVISHFPNKGRGASIREGVLAAKGDLILETDADNSVGNEAIGRFLDKFAGDKSIDLIIGSRELKASVITKEQPFLRVFLGYGFIYFAKLWLNMWRIHDFTLGFKMFRKQTAMDIFAHQYDPHYVAEAEIVYVSKLRGWKLLEMPVVWTDDRDSKIHPLRDSIRSFWGMFKMVGRRLAGKYKN